MVGRLAANVTLYEGMAFRATATSGHAITLDASTEAGGQDSGFRPMELLLMGLGGCTGMDVISILRKMRQEITSYAVHVEGDRAAEHPKVYTEITVEHLVKGRGIVEALVRKAVQLSATKYCPTSAMLGRAARITHAYRIVDVDTDEEIAGSLRA